MRFYLSSLIVAMASFGLLVSPAAAVDPSLSGSIAVQFGFQPDDPGNPLDTSYWYFSGFSGAITLTLPSVLDISAKPGPGTLSWADEANWTSFPLNTGGLSINASPPQGGSFTATVNDGSANLDVLRGSGPTESQTQTNIGFTNITPSGAGPCPTCGFAVYSNVANTKYNVTLPAGAHLNNDQFEVNVQNLTVNAGASMLNALHIIRNTLTNHGSGNFGGTVQGNFINDAVAASGNVANAYTLILQGQLQNSGELYVPNYFELEAATSNSGAVFLNGGQFRPHAAFSNDGSVQFSAGTLYGPGTFTNNGSFQWTGGGIDGSEDFAGNLVNTSSTFTISGPAAKTIFGTLTNSGTITQSGGSVLTLSGQTTLSNQAGALYDITDDSGLDSGFQGGTFSNAGTFRKSGGAGTSTVVSAFTNTGAIQVNTGTIKFTGGGMLHGGSISFAAGKIAEVAGGGDFSVLGTTTASGAGMLKISSGHVFVATGNAGSFTNFTGGANLVVSGGHLEANDGGTLTLNLTGASSVQLTGSGTVGGAGTTFNNGNFQVSGGGINGNLTNSSANFTVANGSVLLSGGGTLSNTGTITQSDVSEVQIGGHSTLANQAGALYEIQDDSDIVTGFQSGFLTNAGTLRKSGGTGTSQVGVPFTNTGKITINSGTLQVSGGLFELSSTSTLEFKLAGVSPAVDFGKIYVTDPFALAGTFQASLAPGYTPALGDSFHVIDWNSNPSGVFNAFTLPALSAGLAWNVSQLAVTGILSVIPDILGDYNHNGFVDAADYTVWRDTLGSTTDLRANGDKTGASAAVIDLADYNFWKSHFGNHAGSSSSSGGAADANRPVPEPATCFLLAISALGLIGYRSR
jgi:hypothetical protein